MSKENLEWLNRNVLVGFTAKRGEAWHYKASAQGTEANHYEGAIPLDDVNRRLFSWTAVPVPIRADLSTLDGFTPAPTVIDGVQIDDPWATSPVVPGKIAVVTSDTGEVLGIFSPGYAVHNYSEWLLGTVATILDADLSIGSAGLLAGRAQAWVSVEVPESITTPEGVVFRPNLIACTSHNGSIATTFKRCVTNVVCDNTLASGLGEVGQQLKIRHSRYSGLRMADAHAALAIVHTVADDFMAEVASLTRIDVTDKAWSMFLDAHAPVADPKTSEPKKGRSLTMAITEREALTRLWNTDNRVSPWKGTAFGVLQAVNTYVHHEGIVRGAGRAERNMSRAITGGVDDLDARTIATLTGVLSAVA